LPTIAQEANQILQDLGVHADRYQGGKLAACSPISGETVAQCRIHLPDDATNAVTRAHQAFLEWRNVPAPRRGELVRLLGEELRSAKQALGALVTLEAGKIQSEGLGEVQEMIDICTFAAGLSRQLCGLTIATERSNHRMMETWHPLGVTAIISAFNFPVAVWSWNAALALVCGNAIVWKPSEKTPLTALATEALFERAIRKFGDAPEGLSSVLIGGKEVSEVLVDDARVALVSATGSTAMGRSVAPRVARRFARSILELGGNNAAIVCASADLELALRGIAFSAMGTAGQRCTTLRRLIVHESIADHLVGRLKQVYGSVRVGDPRNSQTLVGPLIDGAAFEVMQESLKRIASDGAVVFGGQREELKDLPHAYYARPSLVEVSHQTETVKRETFAPILYVMRFRDLDEAIAIQNDVPQGLASSIFTSDLREAETFLSSSGSDCGIANVNIGPSGAEIGGAFGGEKETGGGRESGSDSWKLYMRRATNTINYGHDLPLAQGVRFDVG
jgi:aldehyde dehydrogenase (NAD+)